MSLKLNKRIILIFMVLLMLVLIPMSFASDAGDDGNVIGSADDAVVASSVDDVNATVSASVDTSDDVLGAGEDLIIAPRQSSIDYDSGTGQSVRFDVTKSDDFEWYFSSNAFYIIVDVNDGQYTKQTYSSVQNVNYVSVSLDDYSSNFNSGENTIRCTVSQTSQITSSGLTYAFNPLTVNVAGSAPVEGTDIYVDANAAGSGSGTEADPFKTIADAITKANTMDESTIHIADGTYNENGFTLTKSVTIIGSGAEDVIIDAQGNGRIFDITGADIEVVMRNLTLTNGLASGTTITGSGGAIRVGQSGTSTYNKANLTLDSVIFDSNSATQGGAVYISHGQTLATTKPINFLNIINCIFINNIASGHAGALYTRANTNIVNSTFRENKLESTGTTGSKYGGAIYVQHSYMDLSITGTIFEKNTATGKGGAIYYAGPATSNMMYNAFINNTASYTTAQGTFTDYGISAANEANVKKMDLNNNWWGSNDVNFTKEIAYGSSLSLSYAQLSLTVEPTEITTEETSTISTSFKWNDDTTTDIDKLPVRTVQYTSNGTLTETEGNVGLESTFSATEGGNYVVNANVDNEKLSAIIEVTKSVTPIVGDWYVATAENGGSNDNDGKSRETPFLTIAKALSSASAGDTIVVTEGSYSSSTINTISKSLTIIGDGEVILTRTAGAFFSSSGSYNATLIGLTFKDCDSTSGYGATTMPAALNLINTGGLTSIINCTFIDNKGPSILRLRSEAVISGCMFIDNTAIGNTNSYSTTYTDGFIDFSASAGKTLNMNYNVFINAVYSGSKYFVMSNGGTGNLDYNYWGSDEAITNFDSSKFTLNHHVILNTTIDEPVELGSDYDVDVNFFDENNQALAKSMPELTLDVEKTIGTIDATVTISNNEAAAVYSASKDGNEIIYFKYGDTTLNTLEFVVEEVDDGSKIYVDASVATSGNGSKDSPYKTIQEALDDSNSARPIIVMEGVYTPTTEDYFKLSSNANITGRGNVVLTRENKGYLFDNNPSSDSDVYNITLKNVVIENVGNDNEGIIFYKGTGNINAILTIDNCTIENNGGNYFINASDYYNINISNTNFIENSAEYLIYAGSNGDYVEVNYCNFIGNEVTNYYVCIEDDSVDADTNYNFWGNNSGIPVNGEGNSMVSKSSDNNWVIVDASIEDPKTEIDNDVTFTFKLNDNTELPKSMPTATLDLSAVNGTVSQTVTLTNNVGSATYTTSKEGEDTIAVSAFDKEITTLDFVVSEDETGKLFVNQSYTGVSDGSKVKPFTKIIDALNEAKNREGPQEIIIFDGNYNDVTSRQTLNKDIALTARGDVTVTDLYELNIGSYSLSVSGIKFTGYSSSNNGLFYSSTSSGDGSLTIYNCTFNNLKAYTVLDVGRVNVNLTKVSVVDSTFRGSTNYQPIRLNNANPTLDISYCTFANNTFKSSFFVNSASTKVTADNNFWGTNDKPASPIVSPNVLSKINTWVVLTPSINESTINQGSEYELSFTFNSTTDGITLSELDDSMPSISFDLVSVLGNALSASTITMVDNEAEKVTYTATNAGDEVINIAHNKTVANLTFTAAPAGPVYTISASPDDVVFVVGEDCIVSFVAEFGDLDFDYYSYIAYYVNGVKVGEFDGYDESYEIWADNKSFSINLNDLSYDFVVGETYSVLVRPSDYAFGPQAADVDLDDCELNGFNVTVSAPAGPVYTISASPDDVVFVVGEDCIVSFVAEFGDLDFDYYSYIAYYVNGVKVGEFDGYDESYEIWADNKSFSINLNDLSYDFVVGETYSVLVRPSDYAFGPQAADVDLDDCELNGFNVTVAAPATPIWYVDDSVETSGDGKTRETAFKTIQEAVNAALDGDTIYVLEGEYLINKAIAITGTDSKSLTILGEGEVLLKSNKTNIVYFNLGGRKNYTLQGLTFDGIKNNAYSVTAVNTATSVTNVNLINCTFKDNKGGSVVKLQGESSIIGCTFINNEVSGTVSNPNTAIGLIDFADGTSLTVNYCNFIDNNYAASGVEVFIGGKSANLDYNFWGSNDGPAADAFNSTKATFNNYVILNAIIEEPVKLGSVNEIDFVFLTNDTDALDQSMPTVDFNLVSALGNEFDSSTITMVDNEASAQYTATNAGDEVIDVTLTNKVTNLTFTIEKPEIAYISTPTVGGENSSSYVIGDDLTIDVVAEYNETEYPVSDDYFMMVIVNGQVLSYDPLYDVSSGSKSFNISIKDIEYEFEAGNTYNIAFRPSTTALAEGGLTLDMCQFNNVTITVKEPQKEVTISADDINMTYKDDETLTANITFNGEAVEVPVAVNINGEDKDNMTSTGGQITFDDLKTWNAGNYTINLTVNTAEYKGSKTVTVRISKMNTTVVVSADEMELRIGKSNYITAQLQPIYGSLSYKSNNESVATVSSWGKVTAVGVGSATITISYAGSANYNPSEANVTVNVPAPDYTSTPTVGGNSTVDCLIGDDLTIDVIIDYGDYDLAGDNMYVYIDGTPVKLEGIDSGVKVFTIKLSDIDYDFEASKSYALVFRPSDDVFDAADIDLGDCLFNALNINMRQFTEDLVIYTTPSYVDNYTIGSSQVITVNVEKSIKFKDLIKSTLYAYIDMNNGEHIIETFDGLHRSVVTLNTWTFDLSEIYAAYFNVGENILNITVVTTTLDSNDLTYTFIPLVVNALEMTSKVNTTIDAPDNISVEVGYSKYIYADLIPSVAGTLSYKSSDESIATVNENGRVSAQGAGTAIITISYAGDDYYTPCEKNVTVYVADYLSIPTVDGNDAVDYVIGDNLTIDVIIEYDDSWWGYDLTGDYMNVYVNGILVKLNDVASEVKEFSIDLSDIDYDFEVGETYVLVFHPADGLLENAGIDLANCLFNNLTITVKAPKENLTLEVTADPITAGEDAVIVVEGLADATGNVTATVDGEEYSAEIVDGSALITVPGLTENTTALISYPGDDNYNAANATVEITVNPAPVPKKDLTLNASTMTLGQNVTIIIAGFENATGNVTVTIGEDSYTSPIMMGLAFVSIPQMDENFTAYIYYPGDDNYNNASTTVDIIAKMNINITASAEPIYVGENATIVITGFEKATGNVTVIAGRGFYNATIIDGIATVTIPGLNNTTTAFIIYIGDNNYNMAYTTVNITVLPTPKENLTLEVTADPITAGEDAVIVVEGLADATGNVTATVDGEEYSAEIVDGSALITVPSLTENATAIISYPGDDKYNAANATVDIVVNPQPKEDLNVSVSADPITAGEDAVIEVGGLADATGNVTATVNGETYTAPIKDGKATITVPGLTENATAIISYPGDDKYNNFTESVDVTVNPKPKENATISIDAPSEATEGDNVTVTVTLPEDATGTVTIGNEVVPVENGTASAVLTDIPAGNTTVPITYSGDDKYNPIETNVTITVKEDTSDIISAPDVTKYYGGSERFVVTVTDYQGTPLANKSVSIVINGVSYTRTTNANGTTSIGLGLPAGTYNVTTTVDNTTIDSVVTILTTVNGTDLVKVFRNATQYYATFLDKEGNYLAEGTMVRFNINGVMYDRKVSGDKGLAKLNINLEQGEYIITAMNLETGEMTSNNITVIPRIVENNDLTKYYRNASQYTVKLIGDDGNPVGAGEVVTFNINGVFYNRTTNASGIAKLNINLNPGDYIITAEYKGCRVSNNIKVLPILTGKDITMKYRDGTKFVATLVDGQGKAYAGQTIQFNINGVFYNRVTDSSGQAKLNINLMAGEYIITSTYDSASTSNTIKITA